MASAISHWEQVSKDYGWFIITQSARLKDYDNSLIHEKMYYLFVVFVNSWLRT